MERRWDDGSRSFLFFFFYFYYFISRCILCRHDQHYDFYIILILFSLEFAGNTGRVLFGFISTADAFGSSPHLHSIFVVIFLSGLLPRTDSLLLFYLILELFLSAGCLSLPLSDCLCLTASFRLFIGLFIVKQSNLTSPEHGLSPRPRWNCVAREELHHLPGNCCWLGPLTAAVQNEGVPVAYRMARRQCPRLFGSFRPQWQGSFSNCWKVSRLEGSCVVG